MITIAERLALKEEALERKFDNFAFELRCCSPGIIESFDEEKQTVRVQLAIKEYIKCGAKEFIEEHKDNVAAIPVPILVDVPICIPSAGGFSLTLPIEPGDECLVVFGDTCMDNWWEFGCSETDLFPLGEPATQKSLRRHNLSDGFAILGVKSQPKIIENYSTDAMELRNEDGVNKISLSGEALTLTFGGKAIVITAAGVEIEGIMFMDHVHMGVSTGGALSQGVSPI